ncbi:MAG: DUF998 domain-containing protein [Spirochaetaceae bacterium]
MLLFIIAAVAYIGIFIFVAQTNAPEEYSSRINTINELGCQTYENRNIMQWGFKGFGVIIIVGVLYDSSTSLAQLYYSIPLFAYGLFMFLSGVFSTKPFEHLVFYSVKENKIHTLFSQLAGLSIALLVVMKLVMITGAINRVVNISTLVFVLYTSAQVGRSKEFRGIYQRVMYLGCFLWLIYGVSL